MFGAIVGDIAGSVYTHFDIKKQKFLLFEENSFFTRNTVMTIAVADAVLQSKKTDAGYGDMEKYLKESMEKWGQMYSDRGYNGQDSTGFYFDENMQNSRGIVSAACVSPCAWVIPQTQFIHESTDDLRALASMSAEIMYNHPEEIRGAAETAQAVWFMLRARGYSEYPDNINKWKHMVKEHSKYELDCMSGKIHKNCHKNESCYYNKNSFHNEVCQEIVPLAMIAFLESRNFEDAVQNAISLGGNRSAVAAITGSIAEAAYGIPRWIKDKAWSYLDEPMKEVCREWRKMIGKKYQ